MLHKQNNRYFFNYYHDYVIYSEFTKKKKACNVFCIMYIYDLILSKRY